MLSSILGKLIFIALGVAAIVVIIVSYFYKTSQSIKYEKRITDFALSSVSDSELSLFDRLFNQFWKIIHNFGLALTNLKFFQKLSQKYEKYIPLENNKVIASDYLSLKIITALFLMILNIISSLKIITWTTIVSWIISFIIGYVITDFVLRYTYNKQKKVLKEEIYDVVVLMNNSFDSGSTIYQTIDTIASKYNGFISDEFAKVARDLKQGLAIEEAFARFEKRVDIKEISYISSALKVLNQNGGNVKDIFKLIEKDLLRQKSLKDEFKVKKEPLKLVYRFSLLIPIIGFIILKIIYPKVNLFSNYLNILIFITLILMYILYIIVMHVFFKEVEK